MKEYKDAVSLLAGAYGAHRKAAEHISSKTDIEESEIARIYEFSLTRYMAKVEMVAILFGVEEFQVQADAMEEYNRSKNI